MPLNSPLTILKGLLSKESSRGFLIGMGIGIIAALPFSCVREEMKSETSTTETESQAITETAEIPVELPSGKTGTVHYKKTSLLKKAVEQKSKTEKKKRGGNRYLGIGTDILEIESATFEKVSLIGGLDVAGPFCGMITFDVQPAKLRVYSVYKF